jgi:transcriptional regulator with AAA-type ATPase domain
MKLGQEMFKSKGEKKSKDEIENKWIKKRVREELGKKKDQIKNEKKSKDEIEKKIKKEKKIKRVDEFSQKG